MTCLVDSEVLWFYLGVCVAKAIATNLCHYHTISRLRCPPFFLMHAGEEEFVSHVYKHTNPQRSSFIIYVAMLRAVKVLTSLCFRNQTTH